MTEQIIGAPEGEPRPYVVSVSVDLHAASAVQAMLRLTGGEKAGTWLTLLADLGGTDAFRISAWRKDPDTDPGPDADVARAYRHAATMADQVAERLTDAAAKTATATATTTRDVGLGWAQAATYVQQLAGHLRVLSTDPYDDRAVCRRCGCTDERACPGGCSWVDDPERRGPLCSRCAPAVLAGADTAPSGGGD